MKAIVNGKVVLPEQIVENSVLLYDDNIKKLITQEEFETAMAEEIIDAAECWVTPGFINMHIHGCMGADTMDGTADALQIIADGILKTGVTAFLPTTMTYDFPKIYKSLAAVKEKLNCKQGAKILGCNLEGPFISNKYKGAQAAVNIKKADFSTIEQYKTVIKLVTIAPEELEDCEFIDKCRENGIIVSIGHSNADYEQSIAAINAGAGHITHLFNALPPLHHRKPGVIGAAFDSAVRCEVIADNIHVSPTFQRMLYKVKAPAEIILITDSMRACMMSEGESELGGQKVFVSNNTARLADGTIAGSIAKMNDVVKNFYENTKAPLNEVINMASLNQARELGIDDMYGSLESGKRADIVILNKDFSVAKTIMGGKTVWEL